MRFSGFRQPRKALTDFWKGLDAVGLDVYRSLATKEQALPTDYEGRVQALKETSDRYASQIDNSLFEIENTVGKHQNLILKEIGYRSVARSFVDPFLYVGQARGRIEDSDQAAAFDAIFRSFWKPNWGWFRGIEIWDTSVNGRMQGPSDSGFTPLGKPHTEQVIRSYFGG